MRVNAGKCEFWAYIGNLDFFPVQPVAATLFFAQPVAATLFFCTATETTLLFFAQPH